MIRAARHVLAVAFLGVVLPGAGCAQGTHDAKDCEKAAKTVEKGHPAHKQQAALNTLMGCGKVGATATASALRDSKTEQDTVVLLSFYKVANTWRDADVMQAAIDIARDASAAAPARVFAIGHLLVLLAPGAQYPYGNLVRPFSVPDMPSTQASVTLCRAGSASHWDANEGTALASTYSGQITQALAQINATTTAPAGVRNAARCVGL